MEDLTYNCSLKTAGLLKRSQNLAKRSHEPEVNRLRLAGYTQGTKE
ncbi:MAG: hypothetical protein KAQ75_11980 [Bacteroidales bacterium]|nr:hypothetical protein [Bacteroidales bacterium]